MIDYRSLQESIEYYESKGFKNIALPWTVSESISNLTKPNDCINYQLKHNDKCLVASGEQSFLYLYNKEFLPKGRFQGTTPCYRDDKFSVIHSKYFIKNELIITDEVTETNLLKTIDLCQIFFESYLKGEVKKIKTDIGYDLEYNGIEIGSYGIRDFGWIRYIYGTGYASRLDKIKMIFNISN